MKGLIFTLFVITAFAFADESQVVGSPRIVIERDAPGGTEQASVIFEKDHVIVTSNSNFTVNQEGSSYLGKFKLPYNEQLLALKEMLATDFEQLVNVKQTFAILEISENDEQIINH